MCCNACVPKLRVCAFDCVPLGIATHLDTCATSKGSSNVVIVYSTRKRAYFTCAKGDGASDREDKSILR